MLKKLKQRFIIITMSGIGIIFLLILLTINISMTVSSRKQGYGILNEYIKRNEQSSRETIPPGPDDPAFLSREAKDKNPIHPGPKNEWFNDMRVFTASYDTKGTLTDITLGKNPNLTEDTVTALAEKIAAHPKEEGSISGYLYVYRESDKGKQLYFLDYAPEKNMSLKLFYICLCIGLAGIVVLFIPVYFLSKWVTRPVQLAFDKQKQFIADASHELKTPLTIITTNAEVLESTLMGNKWLTHILEQSNRMRSLIGSLLELAKLDSYKETQDFILFDLSKAVRNAALSFESLAFEYGKSYEIEIDEGLKLVGSEANMKQLVTILLDNAFKYSDENGTILIRLSKHGEKKELMVRNTGKGIQASDQKRIFERFYRSDASRSRESGGYGLGLSIAQSVVLAHKGHISVKSDECTYTAFYVTLQ